MVLALKEPLDELQRTKIQEIDEKPLELVAGLNTTDSDVTNFTLFDTPNVVGASGEERIEIGEDEWERHPKNPRNWRGHYRWKNALIISVTGFLRYVTSPCLHPTTVAEAVIHFGIFGQPSLPRDRVCRGLPDAFAAI